MFQEVDLCATLALSRDKIRSAVGKNFTPKSFFYRRVSIISNVHVERRGTPSTWLPRQKLAEVGNGQTLKIKSHQPSGRQMVLRHPFQRILLPRTLFLLGRGFYPFPTLPRGPWTGGFNGAVRPRWRPRALPGAIQKSIIFFTAFLTHFGVILAPKIAPKTIQNQYKIRSGPEAPGRVGIMRVSVVFLVCFCCFCGVLCCRTISVIA